MFTTRLLQMSQTVGGPGPAKMVYVFLLVIRARKNNITVMMKVLFDFFSICAGPKSARIATQDSVSDAEKDSNILSSKCMRNNNLRAHILIISSFAPSFFVVAIGKLCSADSGSGSFTELLCASSSECVSNPFPKHDCWFPGTCITTSFPSVTKTACKSAVYPTAKQESCQAAQA